MNSALISVYFLVTKAAAQVFNGPGLAGGVEEAGLIEGPIQTPLRDAILTMLHKALGFLALAAAVMLIVAGLMLIFSGGSDTAKDRAKKTVLYVAIGLLVILLARASVGFFLTLLS